MKFTRKRETSMQNESTAVSGKSIIWDVDIRLRKKSYNYSIIYMQLFMHKDN